MHHSPWFRMYSTRSDASLLVLSNSSLSGSGKVSYKVWAMIQVMMRVIKCAMKCELWWVMKCELWWVMKCELWWVMKCEL